MATSKGITRPNRTIGGITFYMRKGKPCERVAGGPSKEKIANSKSCQRTRENNAEFKGALAASKMMRLGLGPFMKQFADWNISGRLNGVFRNIINQADGVRGERPVDLKYAKGLLTGFDLNKERPFERVFKALFSADFNAERNGVSLNILSIKPKRMVKAPSGATHFRLVNALVVIPKFVYDASAKQYFRTDGRHDVVHAHLFSEYIPFTSNTLLDFSLKAVLPDGYVPSDGAVVVCCMGVEFYKEVGGVQYALESGRVMKVVGVK